MEKENELIMLGRVRQPHTHVWQVNTLKVNNMLGANGTVNQTTNQMSPETRRACFMALLMSFLLHITFAGVGMILENVHAMGALLSSSLALLLYIPMTFFAAFLCGESKRKTSKGMLAHFLADVRAFLGWLR